MRRSLPCVLLFMLCEGLLGTNSTPAQESQSPPRFIATREYLQEHFTKYEYALEMRDGVKLFTAVYAPKDDSKTYPILLTRTPYGLKPYGEDRFPEPAAGPLMYYANEPFIFVFQDVRGRNGSEGTFEHVRPHRPRKRGKEIDESTDTYDTIDWLVKHLPQCNGRVGMIGTSYPGFYAAAGMIDAHPALKCVSPQAPVSDWFIGDDFRHNGAFYLAHAFRFLSYFGQRLEHPLRQSPTEFDFQTPDGYEFYLKFGRLADARQNHLSTDIDFWQEIIEHDTYDEFWRARNILPHLRAIRPAVMTVGGWYDAEDLYGPLHVYRSVEAQSPAAFNMLVMGPWYHGGWHRSEGDRLGDVEFHQKTSQYYRDQIELPFLRHFLQDGPNPHLPEAYLFETGANQWRRFDTWPPSSAQTRRLYFHPDGRLSLDAPQSDSADSFDQYISDPHKPVPCIPNIAIGMTREHMVDDQRFASSRTDVLVYASDPLESDMTLAGEIRPSLFVSTSGTASDWVVKLIDVYPGDFPNPDPNPKGLEMGGYQQLVRGEAMRGRFRNSFERPEPFEPGKVAKVEYVMPDVLHTFRRGHRIMVHVQSSWFPLIDRNPQTYVRIHEAQPEDYQKATQRVYRSAALPSHVQIQTWQPASPESTP